MSRTLRNCNVRLNNEAFCLFLRNGVVSSAYLEIILVLDGAYNKSCISSLLAVEVAAKVSTNERLCGAINLDQLWVG